LIDEFEVNGSDLDLELLRFKTFLIESDILESNTNTSYNLLFNELNKGAYRNGYV